MNFFRAEDLRYIGHQYIIMQKRASAFDSIALESVSNYNFSQHINEHRDNYDIFLSHSFSDRALILGLKRKIESMGFSVYIDWIVDKQLDRSQVSRDTAETLRKRMLNSKSLIYAFSDNSSKSLWMPWELGFMDGVKKQKVAVMQINENTNSNKIDYRNQEYLGLYYVVDSMATLGGKVCLRVNSPDEADKYVEYRKWLNGQEPYKH